MFTNLIHPFEKSGLGVAPFQCISVRENFIQHPDGSTQAGGCCDYCGTGIRWEYLIRSGDNKSFKVGCDCVEKTGGSSAVIDFKEVRLKLARERRTLKAADRRATRQAQWETEKKIRTEQRMTATAAWRQENATLVIQLTDYVGQNNFIIAMKHQLAEWGSLNNRQQQATESAFAVIDRNRALINTSQHVGEVGQRIKNTKVRVLRCIKVGETRFGYSVQPRILVAMEDPLGNQLTWWTSVYVDVTADFVVASFGIKDHSAYNEIKQTIVTRVKFA